MANQVCSQLLWTSENWTSLNCHCPLQILHHLAEWRGRAPPLGSEWGRAWANKDKKWKVSRQCAECTMAWSIMPVTMVVFWFAPEPAVHIDNTIFVKPFVWPMDEVRPTSIQKIKVQSLWSGGPELVKKNTQWVPSLKPYLQFHFQDKWSAYSLKSWGQNSNTSPILLSWWFWGEYSCIHIIHAMMLVLCEHNVYIVSSYYHCCSRAQRLV